MTINTRSTGKFYKLIVIVAVTLLLCVKCKDSVDVDEYINLVNVGENTAMVLLGIDYYEAVTGIKTTDGIVIIDAGTSPSLTKKYRDLICNELADSNIVCVINTHAHNDHTGGNSVFGDSKIIAHEQAIREMKESWKDPAVLMERYDEIVTQSAEQLDTLQSESEDKDHLVCQWIRYSSALEDMKNGSEPRYPDATFHADTTLTVGDKTFELFYFGNAHSSGDIMVYVPSEKLLFTGDLFFKGGRPSINTYDKEDVERWGRVLTLLLDRDIMTIIQGHGLLLDKTDLEEFYSIIKSRMN